MAPRRPPGLDAPSFDDGTDEPRVIDVTAREAQQVGLTYNLGGVGLASSSSVPVDCTVDADLDSAGVVPCKVRDLGAWLSQVSLREYHGAASQWCAEMGAVSLEEIAENIQDFCEAISLKPIEKQRVQKWALQLMSGQPLETVAAQPSSSSTSYLPVSLGAPTQATSSSSAAYTPSAAAAAVAGPGSSGGAECVARSSTEVYAPRSVRLAMDSRGFTGLDLEWDTEWGIVVRGVDPLPGQPGLSAGDYLVAIDGCSLRHLSPDECDAAFSKHLQNGAILSIVTPIASGDASGSKEPVMSGSRRSPMQQAAFGGRGGGKGGLKGRGAIARLPQMHRGRGGYDANRMWRNFRGPPW